MRFAVDKKGDWRRPAVAVMACILAMLMAPVVTAEPFVSYNGNFFVEIPEGWTQVDYQTVDTYLLRGNASAETFDYEAVFAPSDSDPFFSSQYIIMSIDTSGQMSPSQVDSVLSDMSSAFAGQATRMPMKSFLSELPPNRPVYDRETGIAAIFNEQAESSSAKHNIIFIKFYERGSATFFFYTPPTELSDGARLAFDMINSLSTENVADVIPNEEVQVADLSRDRIASAEEEESTGTRWWFVGGAIVIALFVILVLRRKR